MIRLDFKKQQARQVVDGTRTSLMRSWGRSIHSNVNMASRSPPATVCIFSVFCRSWHRSQKHLVANRLQINSPTSCRFLLVSNELPSTAGHKMIKLFGFWNLIRPGKEIPLTDSNAMTSLNISVFLWCGLVVFILELAIRIRYIRLQKSEWPSCVHMHWRLSVSVCALQRISSD